MNSFGKIFRVSVAGESHGSTVSVVIDGVPPGIEISEDDMLKDLAKRKSGKKGTTPRIEADIPEIKTGVFNGRTTGAPVLVLFSNTNTRSRDYSLLQKQPRPGHADLTGMQKYKSYNDYRGGGHFSGRLTLGIVAAGTIAKKIIHPTLPSARLVMAGNSRNIEETIDAAMERGDSVGGIIECTVTSVSPSLGEPYFDSAESIISHAVFSIPGIRGIEFGSGFQSAEMTGSIHNDAIADSAGRTLTNNSGGINGGITNGNDIFFRIAVKPTSSISLPQKTVNLESGEMESLEIPGRHDCCFALRVPPVVEAVTAIALADMKLLNKRID